MRTIENPKHFLKIKLFFAEFNALFYSIPGTVTGNTNKLHLTLDDG